ncbi:MAG: quaternary ammonium compound efflux SMR transporter SugE [Cephaloticoccus sp.]|nr:quaternary ammonium compound efflux SMR transporter SugE [Cephaloticoccus sp.]MCF7761682.1 quaternary ammonium compound efflux SMR transporter SugE [Cephaloticoccus sp.]
MKSWLILLIAAGFEIVWAVGLKSTQGFTRLWPSVGVISAMAISMWLLALAARGLPIGTAYAVWTGIGAVGTAIAGILYFNESASAVRLICIVLIIAGVAGLKFFSR